MTVHDAAEIVASHVDTVHEGKDVQLLPILIPVIAAVIEALITEFGPAILEGLANKFCAKHHVKVAVWKKSPSPDFYKTHGSAIVDGFFKASPEFDARRPEVLSMIYNYKGGTS